MGLYRILLVDDEEQFRTTITSCFPWSQMGYEIAAQASNGEEALKLLRRYKYDLVLCDIQMPIVSGIDLAKNIAEMEDAPIIIFFSGFQEFEYAKKAMIYGVRDYIVKPIRFDELSEVLRKVKTSLEHNKGKENDHISFEKKVQQYVEEHLKDVCLQECANVLHMNPSYVSWLYKQKTGENFSDLVLGKRMKRAAELLKTEGVRVYEVSEEVGYSNSNNFTKIFHSYYGIAPKEYQRIYGGN